MALRFERLTRPEFRRLQPGEKITEHGITAERLRDGDFRYSVNVMVDGQRVHRVVGRDSEGVTRSQAEEFIEKARTEAREGRLQLPPRRKTHVGFIKAADDYLRRLEETGGKNLTAKRRHLTLYLKPFFGRQRLDSITTFTVDRYKRRRQGTSTENGTINRELATLSHLLNKALEWKWIRARPCKVTLLKERAGRIIVLTDEQCDQLMAAALEEFSELGITRASMDSIAERAELSPSMAQMLHLHG